MERCLGMDVHAARSTLAVISESGRQLQTHLLETNGRALVEAVRLIPGRKHLVFEERVRSAWLYEILSPHVDETVVAGVAKSRGQKDDRRDAYGLAEKLRTGTLDKRIFEAPRQFAMLRERARTHQAIGRDLVRAQARLESVYRSRGIGTPGRSVYGKTHREQWRQQLPATARTIAARLYEQIDFLVALKEGAEQDPIRESRKSTVITSGVWVRQRDPCRSRAGRANGWRPGGHGTTWEPGEA